MRPRLGTTIAFNGRVIRIVESLQKIEPQKGILTPAQEAALSALPHLR